MDMQKMSREELSAAAEEWVDALWDAPGSVSLTDLADTFPWKDFLICVNYAPLYSSMHLPMQPGILFTGPGGNGKHTQAEAVVTTIISKRVKDPANLEGVMMARVDPRILAPDLPQEVLVAYIQALYQRIWEFTALEMAEYGAVIFDELERYPVSMMAKIAEAVGKSDPRKCFTVCITEHEDRVVPALKRRMLHCRCSNPLQEQRLAFLKASLEFEVTDYWTEPGLKTQKVMTIQFSGITMEELGDKTEGFGYKNLEELVYLLKLMVVGKGTRNLVGVHDILVELSREEVLRCVAMAEPIVDAPAPGIQVIQSVAANPAPGPVSNRVQPGRNVDVDKMDAQELMDYVSRNDPDGLKEGSGIA